MFAFIYKIGGYSASARWLLNSCHHATKKLVKYCDFYIFICCGMVL